MQIVIIDLIPQKEKPIVKLSQYDNDRQVRFMLEENGEPYTLTGTETVEVNIRKPDRNIVVIEPTIAANAYVDVLFTEQSAACYGESFGELSIKSGETVIGTCNFIIDVEISPIYGGIASATEINNLETQVEEITTEIVGENYYNKKEVDTLLVGKADVSDLPDMTDYYTKTATDLLLDEKANAADVYTKGQVDTALATKADKSDTYTKEQVDNIILDIMPVGTASGPIASFDTELAAPLVNVSCNIVATGGNGTPDNPNPINGYTEANITRCGVNLWDEEWELGTYDNDGQPAPSSLVIRNKNFFKVPTNGSIYIATPTNGIIFWYDSAKNFISKEDFYTAGVKSVPNNAVWANFRMAGGYGTVYNNDISFNLPDTNTSYVAYNGQTYAIAFGQTVYGGVLDVTRGKLHVTRGTVDLGSLNWIYRGSGSAYAPYFYADISGVKYEGSYYSIVYHSECSIYTCTKRNVDTLANNTYCFDGTATAVTQIQVKDSRFTDANVFKSAVTGQTLVYDLATPFDIDLTPEVILAIVGTNNVYSDTNGDTTVQYKDSIQHYIDTHTGG